MEDFTTYNLSYWPNELPIKVSINSRITIKLDNDFLGSLLQHPKKKLQYQPPLTPLDSGTTYRLSYWPNKQPTRQPFIIKGADNILNANFCPDDNTTYKLSYFGCASDRRQPIRPPASTQLSSCPLSHDTIHRVHNLILMFFLCVTPWILSNVYSFLMPEIQMSYLGNWSVTPESPCLPCSKGWQGRGPMEQVTTQKNAFVWKCGGPGTPFLPKDNLKSSDQPLQCKNKLSISTCL